MTKYPIYIPSKGRAIGGSTAKQLLREHLPFSLVVEEQECDAYAAQFGEDSLLVLPFSNRGSVVPARNWIKQHAVEAGHKKHWQLDDNLRKMYRYRNGFRYSYLYGLAIEAMEDFAERYRRVALAGPTYTNLMRDGSSQPPFAINRRVYSFTLVDHEAPISWRGRYNEDVDVCLQAIASGWYTLLFNAFTIDKSATMTVRGGNTDELYAGKGRLRMAQELADRWPGIVSIKWRWNRPQHYLDWTKFERPLQRVDAEQPA